MRKYSFILLILFFSSCGKHIYTVSRKELLNLAKEARYASIPAFIVYKNGDTLKGTKLTIRMNEFKAKEKWVLDEKNLGFEPEGIVAYQDDRAYNQFGMIRILNGKITLFLRQVDNRVLHYSASGRTTTTGGVRTTFYVCVNNKIENPSINNLKGFLNTCPAALKQLETELNSTPWMQPKYLDEGINDYRALIRVLTVFNTCGI